MRELGTLYTKTGARMGSFSCDDDKNSIFKFIDLHYDFKNLENLTRKMYTFTSGPYGMLFLHSHHMRSYWFYVKSGFPDFHKISKS